MSATLVTKDLAGGYGHRTLFDSLNLTVPPGDVIGIVGVNGSGKSTLLRILAGVDQAQAGTVTLSPSDAFVGWLPQLHEGPIGETVAAYVGRRTGCAEATAEMNAAAEALGGSARSQTPNSPSPDDRYALALDRWLASGAADLDERLPIVLAELGVGTTSDAGDCVGPDSAMTSLSGGQAARVRLATLLLSRFDIAMLDEPTNDLDLDGLQRLEQFVHAQRGGLVIVSHDREFLTRCVTRVVELDLAQSTTRVFGGGYDAYLAERETVRRQAREAYEGYADKKADLVARARTQREWSSQGVRNAIRKAPDNDKIRRKASAESAEKQARKVRQMESRIAQLDEVDEPRKEWRLEFSIATAPRSSAVVATLRDAVFRNAHSPTADATQTEAVPFVLGPLSVQVNAGDRIGMTGANGAGKTTLLRGLLGRQQPISGSASLGTSVAIGEIDQARTVLTTHSPLADAFESAVPDWSGADIRTLLAKYGLRADHVNRTLDELSPGERTRAAMALLQARGVNVLVLDEPTNHLDLAAIEQLEHALDTYNGTLMLITHDRRMLSRVRLNRRWHVADGSIHES